MGGPRWEALRPGGLRFVYGNGQHPPGLDSFLLASLPRLKPGWKVCDLGCGTGLLGLLLLQRQRALAVTGLDIQPEAVRLGKLAAAENRMEDRLFFRLEDLRETALPAGSFDLAVCNPPYFPPSAGPLPKGEARRTARTEEACTLEDVCRAAGRLLRWGGAFCLVHKPERLTDLLCALRGEGLEPKRLRLVSLRPERAPSLLLLEARRGGKPGLAVEKPLILENPDGSPTAELKRIYFREEAPL
ncbi:tRNA1(Val) (adenine(37)-N6)-methyltransferase [uncultured Oscillibacter sp.]|uniref:tRNA1(Val) (adenine(37)-N6)-methyltransferase n=1 Tax=uncultured Oscillibacter sp. TaxID=876091 RepID=UPI002171C492|nr:methyltransferase [uncultured Oscillibacter sp.]MCI9010920.1 methyltransferase [Oscillibacter sp.]